jgi:hypothetical protein
MRAPADACIGRTCPGVGCHYRSAPGRYSGMVRVSKDVNSQKEGVIPIAAPGRGILIATCSLHDNDNNLRPYGSFQVYPSFRKLSRPIAISGEYYLSRGTDGEPCNHIWWNLLVARARGSCIIQLTSNFALAVVSIILTSIRCGSACGGPLWRRL